MIVPIAVLAIKLRSRNSLCWFTWEEHPLMGIRTLNSEFKKKKKTKKKVASSGHWVLRQDHLSFPVLEQSRWHSKRVRDQATSLAASPRFVRFRARAAESPRALSPTAAAADQRLETFSGLVREQDDVRCEGGDGRCLRQAGTHGTCDPKGS